MDVLKQRGQPRFARPWAALRAFCRRPPRTSSLVALCALAGLTSCDSLVGAAYRGEPVFSFQARLMQFDDVGAQGYAFRTTLLWLTDPTFDPATDGPRLASAVEQYSAAIELRFPAELQVDVFAPPEPAMLIPDSGLGIAIIVIYEDRDGDGRLSLDASPSEVVGGAPDQALVYARDATAAAAAPFDSPIAAGFQLVRVPIFCAGSGGSTTTDRPDPTDPLDPNDSTCHNPFGAPCSGDGDCGAGGLCLTTLDGVAWPDGSCSMSGNDLQCLPPEDVAFYGAMDGTAYLIAGCERDGDCRDGYRCDDFLFGCVPAAAVPFAPSLPRGAACDVNVGQACSDDSQCGVGACLIRSNGTTFPGGYCTLPISEGVSACEPEDGRAIGWSLSEDGGDTHWFASCAGDDDCRVGEGYECDPWYEVCLPEVPVALILDPELELPAPCHDGFGARR